MLYFPGVSESEFDFEEKWLVLAVDLSKNHIHFEGRGQNKDLELILEYQDSLEYSIGDLVLLPKELFIQTEIEPYEVDYECF